MNMNNELVVPIDHGRMIWAASWLAVFSGGVAINYGHLDLATVSWLGASTSLNYWWLPTYGWRRNLDIATIQFCLWYHIYRALASASAIGYFTVTGLGCLLFGGGWYLASKGRLLEGTLCHVGVHLCANTANVILYTSEVPKLLSIISD